MPTVNLSCFRAWGRFPLDLFPSVPLNHRRTGDAVYSETVSHRPVLTRSSVGWAMSLWVLLAGRRWGRWLCNDRLICCFRGAEPMHERFPLTYSITQQRGLDGNVLTSGVRGGEEDFAECGKTGKRDFWILWLADKTRCCEIEIIALIFQFISRYLLLITLSKPLRAALVFHSVITESWNLQGNLYSMRVATVQFADACSHSAAAVSLFCRTARCFVKVSPSVLHVSCECYPRSAPERGQPRVQTLVA